MSVNIKQNGQLKTIANVSLEDWVGTKAEYDELPATKLTDGRNYFITDYDGGETSQSDKTAAAGVIGEVIAYMGNTAPDHFLACDGTVYAISSYPALANHIKVEFGSINFFGGDGTNTFAVPDLRGEFLRGTGTNSHEDGGNGEDVGSHQKATTLPYLAIEKQGASASSAYGHLHGRIDSNDFVNGYTNADFTKNSSALGVLYTTEINLATPTGTYPYKVGVRPTNTSVLYCIRYAKDSYTELSYSTEEQFTGKYWIDGKKLYQKTYEFENIYLVDNSWTKLLDLSIESLTNCIITYTTPDGFVHSNYIRVRYWDNVLYGAISREQSIVKMYLTIQYTKMED